MTTEERAIAVLKTLSIEKQQVALEFLEFLQAKSEARENSKASLSELLRDPEIVGMWSDRPEMEDSTEWVRQLRRREW
ncbi:hypothetical protein, partial [Escherichia coli]|uniref:hypothetical protein n=1 Tax=Escherichia coli TaxID=562 RepID=UPI00390C8727